MLENCTREEIAIFISTQQKAALLELECIKKTAGRVPGMIVPEDSPEDVAAARKLFQSLLTPEQKARCEQLAALLLEIETDEEISPEKVQEIAAYVEVITSYLKQVTDVHARAVLLRQSMLGKPFYLDEKATEEFKKTQE